MNQRKLFLQLGRLGDIINVLPLAQKHFQTTGEVPLFMVAQEFASILEGVSYVEPVIFPGNFIETPRALLRASQLTTNITCTQIYGQGISSLRACSSFARESWYKSGAMFRWGSLPLEFDRRSSARERALLDTTLAGHHGPFVLVALEGKSSPFPWRKKLLDIIKWSLRGTDLDLAKVVDLSEVKADRFYDLLGLYDRAEFLITIDTGHLHLSRASAVPVISLITREPNEWHGSAWMPQDIASVYYDEFSGGSGKGWEMMGRILRQVATRKTPNPTIIHATTNQPVRFQSDETKRRLKVAAESWRYEYDFGHRWKTSYVDQERQVRSAIDLGETNPLSFVKDVIEQAAARARPGDYIALTNGDVCFVPGLTGKVLEVLNRYPAAYTHRWDFERLEAPFIHDGEIREGDFYPGSDAFFFRVEWIMSKLEKLGDYVFGREYWDQGLRQLIKYEGGIEIRNAIYHEKHASDWEKPENRKTLAGNVHNEREFRRWLEEMSLKENDHEYWQVNSEVYR